MESNRRNRRLLHKRAGYRIRNLTYEISEPQTFEPETTVSENEYAPSLSSSSEYQFETNQSYEAPKTEFETPAYETPTYEAESFAPTNGASYDAVATENGKTESFVAETPVETVAETVVKQPTRAVSASAMLIADRSFGRRTPSSQRRAPFCPTACFGNQTLQRAEGQRRTRRKRPLRKIARSH